MHLEHTGWGLRSESLHHPRELVVDIRQRALLPRHLQIHLAGQLLTAGTCPEAASRYVPVLRVLPAREDLGHVEVAGASLSSVDMLTRIDGIPVEHLLAAEEVL